MRTRTMATWWEWRHSLQGRGGDGSQPCGDGVGMGTGTTGTVGMGSSSCPRVALSNTCIQEIEASMDMDISMDILVKSVDMDIDAKFHIHDKPPFPFSIFPCPLPCLQSPRSRKGWKVPHTAGFAMARRC